MPKKPKDKVSEAPAPELIPPVEKESPAEPEQGASKTRQFYFKIPIDASGEIDLSVVDSYREATRSALKKVLESDGLRAKLGLGAPSAAGDESLPLDPAIMAGVLLHGESIVMRSALGYFLFTRRGKPIPEALIEASACNAEEVERLAPLVMAVLNKHAGAYVQKLGPEAFLIMAYLGTVKRRVDTALHLIASETAPQKIPSPQRPIPPVTETVSGASLTQ